jgi:acyl-CoA thioesterase II
MAVVESAWDRYPDYRIDLVPVRGRARVWHGGLLLAESTEALRLIETDHVERLYLPEDDVRLELLESNDHHTVCPFKGEADYWSLGPGEPEPTEANLFWTYQSPFPEVVGIKGYLGVYHEKVRVEIETRWEGDSTASTVPFPAWGDEDDLLRLIEAMPSGPDRFAAPGYHERSRNVVEGGQLLAQALVAASKMVPEQRPVSAYMAFPKAATFDEPIELSVEPLRLGRTFSTLSVRGEQSGTLVSPAVVLMASDSEEVIQDAVSMPEAAGPEESEPYEMRVIGRAVRVVDGAYSPDPDRIGPPELYAWLRFRDDPTELYLRRALLTQATTHWTIAAAMRPHPGVGEADAHVSLSSAPMSLGISFHDDAPLDQWFLYANRATWSGRGLCHGEGQVFSRDGRLLASYTVDAMLRRFAPSLAPGKNPMTAM